MEHSGVWGTVSSYTPIQAMPDIQFPKRRILVVEDEFVGLDVKATLQAVGCVVFGPITTVVAAVEPCIPIASTQRC